MVVRRRGQEANAILIREVRGFTNDHAMSRNDKYTALSQKMIYLASGENENSSADGTTTLCASTRQMEKIQKIHKQQRPCNNVILIT